MYVLTTQDWFSSIFFDGIMNISSISSSNIDIFTQNKHEYEAALKETTAIRPKLFINLTMKQQMYVIGTIQHGQFIVYTDV